MYRGILKNIILLILHIAISKQIKMFWVFFYNNKLGFFPVLNQISNKHKSQVKCIATDNQTDLIIHQPLKIQLSPPPRLDIETYGLVWIGLLVDTVLHVQRVLSRNYNNLYMKKSGLYSVFRLNFIERRQNPFLAHLSWKLKWAFLIACCLSSVCPSVNFWHFQVLLQNHWENFNQTWHKASMGGGASSLSNEEPSHSQGGDNWIVVKINWKLKILKFFSRTSGLNSTKIGTKHSWVKGRQVCSNEGPRPFLRGDNSENVKLYWKY